MRSMHGHKINRLHRGVRDPPRYSDMYVIDAEVVALVTKLLKQLQILY
jgi:hypothetical protein